MNNGDKPSMPTPDEYEYGNLVSIGEQCFTKREACGLKILCSMLTPAEAKARWQAESLESLSLQRPPGSMQRAWLQEEAAEIRRQCEEN